MTERTLEEQAEACLDKWVDDIKNTRSAGQVIADFARAYAERKTAELRTECEGLRQLKKPLAELWQARYDNQEAELAALRARLERMETTLRWYGENARLCRLIHSEGDAGRRALDADGGKRARDAIAAEPATDTEASP